MKREEINRLARSLESLKALSNTQRIEVLRSLERYAKGDLYGAARLVRDHFRKDADFRLPSVIQSASRIAKHFEERTHESRRAVDVYGEQDRHIRQPSDGQQYRGPIVGTTPKCLIQLDQNTGDLVVHARDRLSRSIDLSAGNEAFTISYPFKAIGGIGLVRSDDHINKADLGVANSLGRNREHTPATEYSR